MKLPNLFTVFQKKESQREKMLMKHYEEGRILQVDNGVDNQEYFDNISPLPSAEVSSSSEEEGESNPPVIAGDPLNKENEQS